MQKIEANNSILLSKLYFSVFIIQLSLKPITQSLLKPDNGQNAWHPVI